MSWNQITVDWSDSEVVPAIRYPSTHILSTDETIDFVFATVESVNATRDTPGEILDSLNNWNMGNIEQPSRFTIEVSCFPHGKGFDLLHKCSLGRRYFDIVLAPADYFDGTLLPDSNIGSPAKAWNPGKTLFKGCKVRRVTERYAIGAKPLITFTCTALRFGMDQAAGGTMIEIGNGTKDLTATDEQLRITQLQN
jgi:hypothetical protein